MALAKFAEDENQGLLPLTLDSRRAFASQLAMEPEGSAILERYPFLEEGLAALLDDGHMDAAFRLLGRMLSPAKSILWVVLSHDFADRNKASVSGESEKVRRALLAFAIEPQAVRLRHGQTVLQRQLLDRRGLQLHAAPRRAVGLGQHQGHGVARRQDGVERHGGKFGRASEGHAQRGGGHRGAVTRRRGRA